jgi:predicted DNA-binding protein (MmcQ/YjbR family)
MNRDEYNLFCGSLAHTFHVVQWGDSHVWKVGGGSGKLFAVASTSENEGINITFKCSPLTFEILRDQNGLRPAPYLASRGMSWIQHYNHTSMNDETLRGYLTESHRLASLNLTKTIQKKLGLNQI